MKSLSEMIMESMDRIEKGFSPDRGKGEEIQDFVYAEDVARANLLLKE